MTDQTESASEYDILCRRLAGWEHGLANEDSELVLNAIAAIRALEAKVEDLEAGEANYVTKLGLYRYDFDKKTAEIEELRADRDRLAGEVERMTGLYNQRMVHLHAAQDREVALLDEVERIRVQFDEAIARIEDMLEEDDGQAFKEAGKFLIRIKGHDHES